MYIYMSVLFVSNKLSVCYIEYQFVHSERSEEKCQGFIFDKEMSNQLHFRIYVVKDEISEFCGEMKERRCRHSRRIQHFRTRSIHSMVLTYFTLLVVSISLQTHPYIEVTHEKRKRNTYG
jgi:hypothetical protein